tara:strand:- start:296 stop:544 length:249 start_codon:yes stop_codon:yes gene_type:complete
MAKKKKGGTQNAWEIPKLNFFNMFTILLLLIIVSLIISMFLEELLEVKNFMNYEEAAKKGLGLPDWAVPQSRYAKNVDNLPV